MAKIVKYKGILAAMLAEFNTSPAERDDSSPFKPVLVKKKRRPPPPTPTEKDYLSPYKSLRFKNKVSTNKSNFKL